MKKRKRKSGYLRLLTVNTKRIIRFFNSELWIVAPDNTKSINKVLITPLRVIYMTVYSFVKNMVYSKASYLTYNTVLSIVPTFAIIVGIAKGFGFFDNVKDTLHNYLPNHYGQIDRIFMYVDNYLSHVKGGLFIGLGFVMLLYTVLMMMSSIEESLNGIWQAPFSRSWTSRIFKYIGFFLLFPIIITMSSVFTVTYQTVRRTIVQEYVFIEPVMNFFLALMPVVLIILLFTMLYIAMPNVKVKFFPAIIAGAVSGIAFQLFQMVYISGILWISQYNAIYGSFAVFPLLLLWLNFSWMIFLFGAQLAFCIQNSNTYYFYNYLNSISNRYEDFVALVVMSQISEEFKNIDTKGISVNHIANKCNIPMVICNNTVNRLLKIGVINEIKNNGKEDVTTLQPAIDTSILTTRMLLERLYRYGNEELPIDRFNRFYPMWQSVCSLHKTITLEMLDKPICELKEV